MFSLLQIKTCDFFHNLYSSGSREEDFFFSNQYFYCILLKAIMMMNGLMLNEDKTPL